VPVNDFVERSVTVLGTAFVPAAGTGTIALACGSQTTDEFVDDAQMLVTKVANFF
jgi:hypothetical protein